MGVGRRKWKKRREEEVEKEKERGYLLIFVDGLPY